MLGDGDKIKIGTPRIDGAGVSATVVRQTRGPKILSSAVSVEKPSSTQGHRQDLTLLKINEIAENAKDLKTTKPAAKETSKRVAPPTAAAKKAVTKKTEPKATAKKADLKAAAKKAVTKKAEPKAVTKKAAAKKAGTKKAAAKKAKAKN